MARKSRAKQKIATVAATAAYGARNSAGRKELRPSRRRLTSGEWLGIGVIATAVLTVAALAAWALLASRGHDFGEKLPVQYGRHINSTETGNWQTDPPSSGEHYPALAPWGYSDRTIPPGNWLHNLEHGGIAVLYSCPDGCPGDQQQISNFVYSAPRESTFHEIKIVATPYSVPGHRFALVAWGWRLFLDSWDSNTARKFYDAHVNQGPELAP